MSIVLIELFDRVAAQPNTHTYISEAELQQWPTDTVTLLQAQRLLLPAQPAKYVTCSECEHVCTRPLHTITTPSGGADFFVTCEIRDDVNRVEIEAAQVTQWQTSGDIIATALAKQLTLHRPSLSSTSPKRWEMGVMQSKYGGNHIVLIVDDNPQQLALTVAGHTIPLIEIVTVKSNQLKLHTQRLTHALNHPASGGGDIESAEARCKRIKKRIAKKKKQGIRGYMKETAEEEGISVTRLRQIINRKSCASHQ